MKLLVLFLVCFVAMYNYTRLSRINKRRIFIDYRRILFRSYNATRVRINNLKEGEEMVMKKMSLLSPLSLFRS